MYVFYFRFNIEKNANDEKKIQYLLLNSFKVKIKYNYNHIIENSVLEEKLTFEKKLFLGGPVAQDSLFFLLRQETALLKDSVHIKDDLYWGGDFDHLKLLIKEGRLELDNCRFFLGYSGWSEDQLEYELEKHSWIITDIRSDEMFVKNPEAMWQDVLRNMGGNYKAMSNYPIDPRLN